jgi:hypothetical protein
MNDISELLVPLRRAIYPLCSDTGYEQAPVATFGTCFLVELKCGFFAVTLKHVVMDTHVSDLFIFEESELIAPIRFKKKAFFKCTNSPDSEIADLALLEVDLDTMSRPAPAYNLGKMTSAWERDPKNYHYRVFGYPSVQREIDYDNKHIETVQHCLNGVYAGRSMLTDCYKIEIFKSESLESCSLDGYSGSPVFAWHNDAESIFETEFCGVAIQGKGNTLNFLRRWEIDEAARYICS